MLEGKNIILRNMKESDLDDYVQLTGDARENGNYFPLIIRSKPLVKKVFDETGFWEPDKGRMMITGKSERLIGFISYFKGAFYNTGYEIGLQIFKKEDRDKGYATEALQIFSAYMFEERQIHRLQICMDKDNVGSKKLAEKCGYKWEGTMRQVSFTRGRYHDLELYSLLRDECPGLNKVLGND